MHDFAVVFDMDGVIIDTERFFDKHQLSFLKRLGVQDIDPLVVESVRHTNSQTTWETFKKHFSLTQPIEELIKEAREDYLNVLKNSPDLSLNSGVDTLIDDLREHGIPLAVASTASMKRIRILFERFNLLDKFEVLVCGDDVQHSKPAPDAYLIAAEKLRYDPRDCVAIEDSAFGVQSAVRAGMSVVAYAPEYNVQDVSQADCIIKDFHDIHTETFSTLWSRRRSQWPLSQRE